VAGSCEHGNEPSGSIKAGNVLICNSVFLGIVYRLYFNKITTFRKLDLLPSSGKTEKDRNPSC
jgi:hypothetical protein